MVRKFIKNYKKFIVFHFKRKYSKTRKSLNTLIENTYRKYLQSKTKNKDFSIISSNCWGGGIYEDLDIPYATPTVGLFFYTPCYIKFVQNLKTNINSELIFVNKSKYEKANLLRSKKWYPIGVINNDIEIHFLHYESEKEAQEKWHRRSLRLNFNNIFLSLNDIENYTIEELKIFDSLPYPKVFFSSKKIKNIKSLVWLKKFKKKGQVGDLYNHKWQYRFVFNIAKWLNKK